MPDKLTPLQRAAMDEKKRRADNRNLKAQGGDPLPAKSDQWLRFTGHELDALVAGVTLDLLFASLTEYLVTP